MRRISSRMLWTCLIGIAIWQHGAAADEGLAIVDVEGQPLAANVDRLLQALDYLGTSLPENCVAEIRVATQSKDSAAIQRLIDSRVLFEVSINPESRVKVRRGPATAILQQAGYTPVLVKVVNASTVTKRLRITSPQAGPVYAGVAELSMKRQQQEELRANENTTRNPDRFLAVEMFDAPPMTDRLSGLAVEYAVALIYSSEAGKREATIGFDVGQGNQDLGFRGETPVLFDIRPAISMHLSILDVDNQPTVAKLTFRDAAGHVFPPQAKRLAPDFFFQPHIYRGDGETVLLPPGKFRVQYSRGPEYRVLERDFEVAQSNSELKLKLQRWVNPRAFGFYSGDHHIHAAGCAHYTSPTEGVAPADMFRQVKGEAMNVGCVLTWGPCYDFQRQFFAPKMHDLSEPMTVLKYDLEISGFGSQSLGHVCLLNLKNQTYPGSEGTSTKGWPTWTTPVMRWTKEQGGYAGYAHSASGLAIDPTAAAKRRIEKGDGDRNGMLGRIEADTLLLPEPFDTIDEDRNGQLTDRELINSHQRAAEQLPNYAVPEMNGVGAMEIAVTVAEGVCDFISAMDTARIQEWNTWYHIMNCGFPLKVSGETDFPCMASRNVGQGRVYVRLGDVERINYETWCAGLASGRSYVSDGYAHALDFAVNDVRPGEEVVRLDSPGEVQVRAKVSFAAEQPLAVAHGGITPETGKRVVGDTVLLHGPRREEVERGGERLVEIVVNGEVIAKKSVPADGATHDLELTIPIRQSSWVALREFPQLHTNPVNVLVADKPIRASRRSAEWCVEMTELLWKNRERNISPPERQAAKETFDRALGRYRQIASEAVDVNPPAAN
jgi:hypothetical protein